MFEGRNNGIFVPSPIFQSTARFLFVGSAPLFEKERNFGAFTLVSNFGYPFFLHGTGTRPAFSANYYPVDSPMLTTQNGDEVERTQKRFTGKKPDRRRQF